MMKETFGGAVGFRCSQPNLQIRVPIHFKVDFLSSGDFNRCVLTALAFAIDPQIQFKKVLYALQGNSSIDREIQRLKKEVEDESNSFRYGKCK